MVTKGSGVSFCVILFLLVDVVLPEGMRFLMASQPLWSESTNTVVLKNGSTSQLLKSLKLPCLGVRAPHRANVRAGMAYLPPPQV